ncbi:hypothetical protein SAMN06264364_10418 [Quadrisphaera granulorum]|uniref:RES domain-containing protein n=1 Tax=Quadrisphaera granulorum TaxID=317664 RepID=A0A316AY03_9ACTN|nr:hypothetical protein [Quadrisphaera granulorum]PWJ55097.1 hypothetical protein BXY45_10418 [Quadrisphaera granulorum]SZE95606.1 hypothetical protein SAMN06264364_10418 [Quadrisphaera granulorum]
MSERLPRPQSANFPDLAEPTSGPPFVRVLTAGHRVGRIFMKGGPHPSAWRTFRHFGPTSNRFDHHPPPPGHHSVRAVQYAAPGWTVVNTAGASVTVPMLQVCLLEVYRSTRTVDVVLNEPWYAQYVLDRDVRLLDLSDSDWITRAGGNAAISSGAHGRSREWSRAIYNRYDVQRTGALDGVFYQCSNLPRARSLMFFESGLSALPATAEVEVPLAHPILRADIERICHEARLALVP